MNPPDWLDWPFFDDRHRELAAQVQSWCSQMAGKIDHSDTDAACRGLVMELGKAGLLGVTVPEGPNGDWGGAVG